MTRDDTVLNQGLIRVLYDRYYQQNVRSQDMSSHWVEFSSQFNVQRQDDGTFTALEGAGFGDLHWGSVSRRVMHDLCIGSHLLHLPQRSALLALRRTWSDVCRRMGIDPTFDTFRQVCTLELLKRWTADVLPRRPLRFLMIGDGYGVLAALVKAHWPDARITLVDLGQSLIFQAFHLQRAYPPPHAHALAGAAEAAGADFVYCPSDHRESLDASRFDVAVNVASMQEMDPAAVASYFAFLRGHMEITNLFYCCNREWKRLPDGQVSAIAEYPWAAADRILVEEPCPWHQYDFTPRPAGRGPRVLGLQVPGVSHYDGTHRHRLVTLQTVVS